VNAIANDPNVMASLKYESKELNLSEINLTSPKHTPTKDTQKIKLDRVINSLLPDLEELESDIY